MPGRKFSSSTTYRYGFNGKEEDDEVKGDGNQQDYGMRVYDTRLGKFLSIDPLTKDFPALSPFQFSSNNPVEGIDLDGLEYVSSKKARIDFYNGTLSLKLENMASVVKNILTDYNNKTENWASQSIGADFSIGKIKFSGMMPKSSNTDADPSDASSSKFPYITEVGKPITKSRGLPDRRYSDKEITTASPAGARGIALLSVLVDITAQSLLYYIENNFKSEEKIINEQIGMFKLAASDVNYVLNNTTLIPPNLRTELYISDIVNVVLTGTSNIVKTDKKTGEEILKIGIEIYNTYSRKRTQFSGTVNLNMLSGQSKQFRKPDPNYDPKYVNENPPIDNE